MDESDKRGSSKGNGSESAVADTVLGGRRSAGVERINRPRKKTLEDEMDNAIVSIAIAKTCAKTEDSRERWTDSVFQDDSNYGKRYAC